jgi:hypothetical protein
MILRKWDKVTREERFFTCILFHDILQYAEPLRNLLQDRLKFSINTKIIDISYEVCFFRDSYHTEPKLIKRRQQSLEKQTFDLMLWLSDQSAIIIEAKAQQGFHNKQMQILHRSLKLIPELSVSDYPIREIFLVGLCSSLYNLKERTADQFCTVVKWREIAQLYPAHQAIYERADSLYGN